MRLGDASVIVDFIDKGCRLTPQFVVKAMKSLLYAPREENTFADASDAMSRD